MFKKNSPVKVLYDFEIGGSKYGRIFKVCKSGLESPFDKDYKIRLIDGHETEICDPAYIDQISEESFRTMVEKFKQMWQNY